MERLISGIGLLVFIALAWLLSSNRRQVDFRLVGIGVGIQFLLALTMLATDIGQWIFQLAQKTLVPLTDLSDLGAEFLFGKDFRDHFFAFKVLPTIIFFSALSSILFHLKILQKVIGVMGWLMRKALGITGSESLVTAANVFIGQTEAPLFVKPYVSKMTSSELMTMMVGGMATAAGGVLAAYVSLGISAGHLLCASVMSAPAAIVIARILEPAGKVEKSSQPATLTTIERDINIFDAGCRGAQEGLKLALNIGAMLIAFIALVGLVNLGLSCLTPVIGSEITLQGILGYAFQPLAFLMGVPWSESHFVGQLLGVKMVLNEFVSYLELSKQLSAIENSSTYLSERSIQLTTYALCGFANFSSVAVQIGGIGALVPERKNDLAKMGMRAMIGGTLATMMTAAIAGLILP